MLRCGTIEALALGANRLEADLRSLYVGAADGRNDPLRVTFWNREEREAFEDLHVADRFATDSSGRSDGLDEIGRLYSLSLAGGDN